VSDITVVRKFDAKTGTSKGEISIPWFHARREVRGRLRGGQGPGGHWFRQQAQPRARPRFVDRAIEAYDQ
jgi:hypothetical protein